MENDREVEPTELEPKDKQPPKADEIGAKDVKDLDELPPEDHEALAGEDLKGTIRLKWLYGRGILSILAVQLIVVNAAFAAYAWAGYDWRPPERVVEVWLVGTFVQIVSIVIGITRSLFPPKDSEKGS